MAVEEVQAPEIFLVLSDCAVNPNVVVALTLAESGGTVIWIVTGGDRLPLVTSSDWIDVASALEDWHRRARAYMEQQQARYAMPQSLPSNIRPVTIND